MRRGPRARVPCCWRRGRWPRRREWRRSCWPSGRSRSPVWPNGRLAPPGPRRSRAGAGSPRWRRSPRPWARPASPRASTWRRRRSTAVTRGKVRWQDKGVDDSGMTRAVVATAYGGPEVLSVIETPLGRPGPGEVMISVRAAATNPLDYKLYSGAMGRDPARLPMRLGFEAAGMVTKVGGDAYRVDGPGGLVGAGDEVVAYRVAGGYAADLVVPASSVIAKPATLSFEQASGMMLTGVTAVHALTVIRASAGETILIYGAAGGVGLMAVQVAEAAGARVIGAASPGGHELLRELGAEPVTYGAGLEERVRALAQ